MTVYPPPLSQDEALVLHARLCNGDPVAVADLAIAYYQYLFQRLHERNPRIEEDHLCDAVWSALSALQRNPASYSPARGELAVYLHMSARGDLMNALKRESRRRERTVSLQAVEDSHHAEHLLIDVESDPARVAELYETVRERVRAEHAESAVLMEGLQPTDRGVLALIRSGEFRTPAFAAVLGITHLPPMEQRSEVKRVKDRLKKRLVRGASHG